MDVYSRKTSTVFRHSFDSRSAYALLVQKIGRLHALEVKLLRARSLPDVLFSEIQLLGDAPRKPHTMFFQYPCRRSAQETRHIRLMTLSTSLLLLERSRMALKL